MGLGRAAGRRGCLPQVQADTDAGERQDKDDKTGQADPGAHDANRTPRPFGMELIDGFDRLSATQRWYKKRMTDLAQSTIQLNDGRTARVRPIGPGDEDLLYDAFSRMSERSVYLRFLSPLKRLPAETAHRLAKVDQDNRYALIAVAEDHGKERLLGVARYDRIGNGRTAEVAVAVPDDVQRQGIGAQLLSRIAEDARRQGITQFTLLVLAENQSMLHLLRKMQWIHQARARGGAYEITFDI